MPTSTQDGNTLKSHKRSLQETVSLKKAARLLGTTERTVRNYIHQGILTQLGGRGAQVALQDVASAASALAQGFDFVTTARLALRALVAAVRSERRLDRVEALLGIDVAELETTEAAVLLLYTQCKELRITFTGAASTDDVMKWAYALSGVTEEYLELVTFYTHDPEPWVVYMEAAQKLQMDAPKEKFLYRRDLEIAYAYVLNARRQLRRVAYFHIRHKHGPALANTAFPDVTAGERDNAILDLIFAGK